MAEKKLEWKLKDFLFFLPVYERLEQYKEQRG